MIFLVDIDGTIADLSHRLHFIENGENKWEEFFDAVHNDKPIPSVIQTVQLLSQAGATILLVTGRSSACKLKTIQWLRDNGVPFDDLYMRREGDHRPDNIVKAELLEQLSGEWGGRGILGVFEDRKQVVDMYRAKGLKVFQVAEGDF
jgi:hypothetical protein